MLGLFASHSWMIMNEPEEKKLRIPSQTFDRFWLFHVYEDYEFKKDKLLRLSGKWLIFDSITSIDKHWKKVLDALDNNLLGPSAKVCTSKKKIGFENNDRRVICVFTEDYNDLDDVWRVEKAIRSIGIENKLLYKLDVDMGKYEKDGF